MHKHTKSFLPRWRVEACRMISCIVIMPTALFTWLALSHGKLLSHERPAFCLVTVMLRHQTLRCCIVILAKRPARWTAVFWYVVVASRPLLRLNVVWFRQILKVIGVTAKSWSSGVSVNAVEGFTVWQQLVIAHWSQWEILTRCSFCHTHKCETQCYY